MGTEGLVSILLAPAAFRLFAAGYPIEFAYLIMQIWFGVMVGVHCSVIIALWWRGIAAAFAVAIVTGLLATPVFLISVAIALRA